MPALPCQCLLIPLSRVPSGSPPSLPGIVGALGGLPAPAPYFSRHPVANFVTIAQRLLPFCIKHIVKRNLLAVASCLGSAHVLGEWLAQVLFLPSEGDCSPDSVCEVKCFKITPPPQIKMNHAA
uniref:Uncharacterized protein n=1 Tax=Prolemur simus TaxID=1328070 RepID=A0A8C8YW93_PROSS